MPFTGNDETVIKWLVGIVAAGISWMWVHITWTNHKGLQQHQLWVANNFSTNKEVKELFKLHVDSVKEDVEKHGEKLDKIMEYLYELNKERNDSQPKG